MDGSYQQPSMIQANSRIVQPVDISPDNTDFLRPIPGDNSARGPTVDQNIYNAASMIRGQQQPFLSPRPSNNNNWLIHANSNQMPVLPPNVQFAGMYFILYIVMDVTFIINYTEYTHDAIFK